MPVELKKLIAFFLAHLQKSTEISPDEQRLAEVEAELIVTQEWAETSTLREHRILVAKIRADKLAERVSGAAELLASISQDMLDAINAPDEPLVPVPAPVTENTPPAPAA